MGEWIAYKLRNHRYLESTLETTSMVLVANCLNLPTPHL